MDRLHHFFEQRAADFPNHIALICQNATLTYQDLNQRANQWAHFLASYGLDKESIVGVLLPRSADLYASMLGILKAGAVYLPFDPDYPSDRINYMLENSQARLLITTSEFADRLQQINIPILYIDKLHEKLSTQSVAMLEHSAITDDTMCYVIYTSGTTGRPKGVVVNHSNIINFVQAALTVYGVTEKDRVYQGFSVAFDASLEEIWSAFASGAALVVGTSNSVHAGANLVEFLNLHEVTVFSTVPTLLSMLEGEIPSLRLLILGGEVCSPELVARWHRSGLRILNTYGPTEATVVSTYYEYRPNQAVTIGRPLPNYQLFILDENLQPIEQREKIGELFIGGSGVAKEYLNQPELTAKKFILHPQNSSQRLYRTGDLVYTTAEGDIQFVGRADEQIKLRGYRIELCEIETVIKEYPSIKNVAVALQELNSGVPVLVGYLLLRDKQAIDLQLLNKLLHKRLPEYMVPTLFEIVAELPMLPSGKVDRKRLAKPTIHHEEVQKNYIAPRNAIEKKITLVWEELFQHQPISIEADFFHDLGGHSLLAAKTISLLRKQTEMSHLSMIDLYENPTIQKLAEKVILTDSINDSVTNKSQNSNADENIVKRYRYCGILQFFASYLRFALASWQFLFIFLVLSYVMDDYSIFSWQFFAALFLVLLILHPAVFAIATLAKWLLLGRVKPGEHRLWGWYYCRWWLVQQIMRLTALKYIADSPLINLYCRLNGMKIGKNCQIGTEMLAAFDLISIDDHSTIGDGAMLFGSTVENGWLKLGNVKIGKRCYVGVKSVLEINTTLEDGAKLDDLSMLPPNTTIPAEQIYSGSPARPQQNLNEKFSQQNFVENSTRNEIFYGLLHYMALWGPLLVMGLALLPGISLLDYFYYEQGNFLMALLIAPLSGALFMVFMLGGVGFLKKIFLKNIRAGKYKVRSLPYLRFWLIERFFLENNVLESLYGSLYLPYILRWMGVKLGRRSEISTGLHNIPELINIGEECFIADWALLGIPTIYGGYIKFGTYTMGDRAFIGNSALLTGGIKLGDGCLIGCFSVAPTEEKAERANTSWFGSPAMYLPQREIFAGFSEKETFNPDSSAYLKRGAIDFIRAITPMTFMFFALALQFAAVNYLWLKFSLLTLILLFPLFDIAISLFCCGIAIAFKWLLVGRFHEAVYPAWSLKVWLDELITCMYEFVIAPMILEPLTGTPFISFFLKLLGAKIGKRVYIDTTYMTEFDLIEIGDDVALNSYCTLQTHLFEDRVIKMGKIKINSGCTLGHSSAMLYNTLMEDYSSLGSLSLLMKGEILPHHSHWAGIPGQHSTRYIKPSTADIAKENLSLYKDDLAGKFFLE